MKIAHISDLHCCKEHAEAALASLKFLADHIRENPVDLIAIAGDIWDASILNNDASGYNLFTKAIRDIADIAPVVMIYGTPAHDTDGSLETFRTSNCKYGISILEPGQAYFYWSLPKEVSPESGVERAARNNVLTNRPDAIIFGIPEPRKKYLLADNSAGKDETEEAIRYAMHRLCYVLAAKRQEHKNIPCIVLYHGDVSGSTLQNDQVIERGTGIAITIDDLADIGADYYALGHIHKPQQAGSLPAYYAGSIYPKNFGETHKAGFNVVEIVNPLGVSKTFVNRVVFPHPENLKLEIRLTDNFKLGNQIGFDKEVVAGKKVWAEIVCTKEQRAIVNADAELQALLGEGAVEGSRVTISEIAVETVRAAEITVVNTPAKKFEVWADNSNITVTKSHIEKIKSLETELTRGAVKAEGEWELVSLRLKGAIGIKKGIKKDEIIINFDDYSSGIIALTGENGKGKTTLIENCHPYPQLLTRKGKLQDHFCDKDSFREVIYRDRLSGTMRKFLIQIDGQNKSGSCKYFIFKKDNGADEWEALPGVDGNLKHYEDVLFSTFGAIDLFQRTAFITQKSTKNLPDITDATAGEKKALFIALAGIEYLQTISEMANEKSKQESAKTHDAEIRMEMLQGLIDKKPQEAETLKTLQKELTVKSAEIAEITEQWQAAKAEVEKYQAEWNAEQLRQQKEDEAKKSADAINAEISSLFDTIQTQDELSNNKPRYEADIAEYEAQQKIIDAENAKKQKITEENLENQKSYTTQKAEHDEKIKNLKDERQGMIDKKREAERQGENTKNAFEREIFNAQKTIDLYERDAAEISENCPTCEQKLPEKKIAALKARRDEAVQIIEREKAAVEKLNADILEADKTQAALIEGIEKQIEEITKRISDVIFDTPTAPVIIEFDDTALKAAIEKQQKIDIEKIRALLTQAQESAVRIEGLRKQIAEKQKLHEIKTAEYEKIKQEAGRNNIVLDLSEATMRRQELLDKYTAVKAEIARFEANIAAAERNIANIAEKEKEYSILNYDSQLAKAEKQEWELITKAFGKDGIQALELDVLAPGISSTANRILESAYGDRFRIDIQTTRIGGAGKKVKQIEDFLIYVIDSEDGESVLLDDKSGGEAVWIKRAIYDAFSVIRKHNTNFAFLTCFQDETDGALDSAAKTAYCRMLEAAHAESKLRHTIIITHSNEVKAMIEQQIDMEELSVKEEV
ncbi:MAG: metallophosphoesterase [Treponema sp.]|jgi:exonuclease SbcC|nr:metallophosphoesterase [Treponema sp.]